MPQANKIWTLSDNPNKTKCSAFCQKGVNYIWQSVDAILEDVSVAKTIVWCKNIIWRPPSFSVPKIPVIRHMIVAVNMVRPKRLMKERSYP